ncbi:hypothetical protein ACHAWO_003950 [Cyclotella atomus]|uniref:Uncharacterized protein n=1 Tax=Cyclotella atomus TaxID=382360 RepID=A0ABD3MTI7_9STRA
MTWILHLFCSISLGVHYYTLGSLPIRGTDANGDGSRNSIVRWVPEWYELLHLPKGNCLCQFNELTWFDYPLYMVLFLSKCNNLNNYLQKTVLRCFINFSDYHKVHRLFGIIVGIESASHSFFHLFRWKCRSDDIKLLYTSQTGITGLIALVCGAFVILPMTLSYLKRCMT